MDKLELDRKSSKSSLEVNFDKALGNKYFDKICKSIDLPNDILMKYTSSLMDASREFENCTKCKGLKDCPNMVKGHLMKASKNNNGVIFSYVECKYKEKEKYKENVVCFDTPLMIKEASIDKIYTDDKTRVAIVKKMKEFKDSYLKNEKIKGIYLYGSFGSGKSYLISALLNELAKNGVKSVIIHVPELLRQIKDSFDKDYSDIYDQVMNVPLLLLDDIGAEYLTAWARDEVLEPILDYRMNQCLPTFFTSNYDINDLEKHFVVNGDKLKAKRIIERIKQLSTSIELVGKNRRE